MQRSATKLSDVEQLSLLSNSRPGTFVSRAPDLDYIQALPSTADAMEYAMRLNKLVPKQVCDAIGKDKTTWSRILSGEWDLACRDIKKFNSAVRNDSLLLFLNHDHGYDIHRMVRIKNDVERRLETAEARIRELEHEREIERAFVRAAWSARK